MRKVLFTIAFVIAFSNVAYGISPVSDEMIEKAQLYGQKNMHIEQSEFLWPWIAYEEKANQLNEYVEHAYVYTPFLFVAGDARRKCETGQKIKLADGKKVIKDYADTLAFSVVLYGRNPDFGKNTKVKLTQGESIIKPYEASIPLKAEAINRGKGLKDYRLQCYFYVSVKKVNPAKPMILSATTGDKKEHRFYFNLAAIQ